MKVYPIGYARSGYKVEQMMERDPDLLIIDLRKSPNSSMPDWSKAALSDGRRLDVPVASIINSGAECTILSSDIKVAIAFALTSELKMV